MAYQWQRLVLIVWVCGAAVAVLVFLIPALHVPTHKLSQSEWERYRREGIMDCLHTINTTSALLKQVYALKLEGHSLNQAVATVLQKMGGVDLSPKPWGGVPIVIEDDEGVALLVDMWTEPYHIAESNGKLVLLESHEDAPGIP